MIHRSSAARPRTTIAHTGFSSSRSSCSVKRYFTRLLILLIAVIPTSILFYLHKRAIGTTIDTTSDSHVGENSIGTTIDSHVSENAPANSTTQQQEPDDDAPPIKIAHAISLISCQRQSRVKGFLDALMILRHSIHQNSIHAFDHGAHGSGKRRRSRYSYQMFAILHRDGGCLVHIPLLKQLGYIALVKDTPVNISEIPESSWYRNHVEGEKCCGSKEFIKLYAYTLTDYPIVVHWDLDVAVLQPMDDLYDAMLHDASSEQGQAARQRIAIQKPYYQKLPNRIDAFFTRDITSARPWENVTAVQGGFLVARPSLEHFEQYRKFILEANYVKGRGPKSGWGGLGYGGFQGAMAYQGVLAYFYDIVNPGHSVQLDVCKWNQVVADVIWRGPQGKAKHYKQCRDHPAPGIAFDDNTPEKGRCNDCRVLPVDETFTVHYTACKKPWECNVPNPRIPRNKADVERLQELTNVTTCGALFHKYFEFRQDIERRISQTLGKPYVEKSGGFRPDFFFGYCAGSSSYISLDFPEDFDMKDIYGF